MFYVIQHPLQNFHILLSAIIIARKKISSKIIEYEFNQCNLLLNHNYIKSDSSEQENKSIQIQEYEKVLFSYRNKLNIYDRLFSRVELLRQNLIASLKEEDKQNIFTHEIYLNISEEELQFIIETLNIAKDFVLHQLKNTEHIINSSIKDNDKAAILQEIQKNKIRLHNLNFFQNYIKRLPILEYIINPILISCTQKTKQIFLFKWYFDIKDKMRYVVEYMYDKSKDKWTMRSIMHQDVGYCPLCERDSTGIGQTDICYLINSKYDSIYIEKEILKILLENYKKDLSENEMNILYKSGIIEKPHL